MQVRLIPAPRGTGIVGAPVPKKLLQMAGIEDCYTSATGSTGTLGNFGKYSSLLDFDLFYILIFGSINSMKSKVKLLDYNPTKSEILNVCERKILCRIHRPIWKSRKNCVSCNVWETSPGIICEKTHLKYLRC